MSVLRFILPLLVICFASSAFGDCSDVLKAALQRTEMKSESELDQKAMDYYKSKEFKKAFQEGKFSGGVVVKGVPLSLGASGSDIDEWSKEVEKKSSLDLKTSDKFYYLQTSGLEYIVGAWKECMSGRTVIVGSTPGGDSGDNERAIVTFEFKQPPGLDGTVESIHTVGCSQEGSGWFGWDKPIKTGTVFSSPSGLSATFIKDRNAANPHIVLRTSAGIGIAGLKQWPAPPIEEIIPDQFIERMTRRIPPA